MIIILKLPHLHSMSTRSHLISIALIASFSLLSVAHADGLKDQWIKRQPQSADFVKVKKLRVIKQDKEKKNTPKEITKEESIATILRKKARQEARTRHLLIQAPAKEETKVEVLPTIFSEEDKIRSIQKQEKPVGLCANLLPRARAECMSKSAFRKTVRMQTSTEAK